MTNYKKFLATGIAAGAMLLSVTTAFAAADANTSVGDDGDAYSKSKDNDKYIVINDNDKPSFLFNSDTGVGVTGLNFQFGGDDNNSIDTGSATGKGASDNFVNSSMTWISDDSEFDTAKATAEVGTNPGEDDGGDGFAKALAFDNDFVFVLNDNWAMVGNFTLGAAVSGLNFQFCNDDRGSIVTGDAKSTATALNQINSNWTYVSDTEGAEATAKVGDDGDAFALAIDKDKFIVINHNDASLLNASAALSLSGGNVQMGGDDKNKIDTGNATATSTATNYINSNITVMNDTGGATATSEVGEDTKLGCGCDSVSCNQEPCLESEAKAIDNDKYVVVNENNAAVVNVSAGVAVSGANVQGKTDDGSSITTGSASGTSTSTNTVNSSWTMIGGGDSDKCPGEEELPCQ